MVIIMKNNKGFTLIELLAVIAILAILILAVTPMVTKFVVQANNLSREKTLSNLEDAAVTYALEHANNTVFIPNKCAVNYIVDKSHALNLPSGCTKITVKVDKLIKDGYYKDDASRVKRDKDVIIYKYKGDKKTTDECRNNSSDVCYNFDTKAYADESLLN